MAANEYVKMTCSKNEVKVAQPCEHIETIELYALKGYSFWYVNTFLNSQLKTNNVSSQIKEAY